MNDHDKLQLEHIKKYNYYKKWAGNDEYLKFQNDEGKSTKKFCRKMMEKYWNLITDENQALYKFGYYDKD